jgi:hypothetical protein
MKCIVFAAALALAATLPAVQAQAQSPRTFVSAAGSDTNPCSFAAPCRHFQAAVNATSAGGEVDALDPAGYGPITISQAVTIEGQGWSYIAPPTGGNGITINAVSGNVAIHGVSINGVGIGGPTTGIQFTSGGRLTVEDSVIRNFKGSGIEVQPSTPIQLYVSNTLLSDNQNHGIEVGSSHVAGVALSHVRIEGNSDSGLSFVSSGAGSAINATVSDSVVTGNSGDGIAAGAAGGSTSVMVRNCTISNNGFNGLEADFAGTTIWFTRTSVTGNANGWSGAVLTFGDNEIVGNTSVNSAPPSISHE